MSSSKHSLLVYDPTKVKQQDPSIWGPARIGKMSVTTGDRALWVTAWGPLPVVTASSHWQTQLCRVRLAAGHGVLCPFCRQFHLESTEGDSGVHI